LKPIAVFYHCLFCLDKPNNLLPQAYQIVYEQMQQAFSAGLCAEASQFFAGVNGGAESILYSKLLLPEKAKCVYHGLSSRSENLTIAEIEKWVREHPGWYVLYFHAKGCTHPTGDPVRTAWRNCMMWYLVTNWRRCVADLDAGYEVVGCHLLEYPVIPWTQRIFAGNFWWARSCYLASLPSIYDRARIKESGIGTLESRFESEVWLFNGPRRPFLRDYHAADPRRADAHPLMS
jgi:hypothetical protein